MTDPTPAPQTPSASDTDVAETQMQRPDSTMFGGYELLAEVARGGMGVVYKARHTALDRIVALKLVLTGSDASESELSRFKVEAKAAARLDHPCIVPVYEIGEHDGQHFFSMGFVDGPSLSVRLAKGGPLPPREAADLLRKVAEAVDYAHRQGIIHRDLKPGNVLLTPSGEPKVTDFGLAKRLDSEHSLTATGQVLGTPAYMAPEQAHGDKAVIGPATDVYSLGATLFAALTGRPPFTASAIHELLIQVTEEQPPAPRTINPKVPAALEAICLKCLAKEPSERYASAGALAEDFQRFLDAKQIHATRRNTTRTSAWLAVMGAAVVLIVVGAGVWFGRRDSETLTPVVAEKLNADAKTSDTTSRAIAPTTKLDDVEEQLLRALNEAQEALLPSPTGNAWEFRYANATTRYEQAFREFGFALDQGDPSQLAETLKPRSPEFRESVLCGLELWELCAVAAKQTTQIEPLRQAQDSLDTLDWRRSLRLTRADTDEKILRQVVREAITGSLTSKQIEQLALLIGSRSPETQPEALALLRELRQLAPDGYVTNLVLASTLQAFARARPAEKIIFASEAVAPLRAAVKARPDSWLPHVQLSFVFTDLGNATAAATESDRANGLLYPQAWPFLAAARKARKEKQYAQAVALVRQALAADPDVPTGNVELAAALMLSGQDAEAEAVLRNIAENAPDPLNTLAAVFRLVDPPPTGTGQPLREFTAENDVLARAWTYVTKYGPSVSTSTLVNWAYWWVDRRPETRLEIIQTALEREPTNLDFRRRMCDMLYALNNDPESLRLHAQALLDQSEPRSAQRRFAHVFLGWAYGRLGDQERAFEQFQAMCEGWPSEGDYHPLARFREWLIAFGQVERGIPLFERLTEAPANRDLGSELALLYLVAGREQDARRCLRQSINGYGVSYPFANVLCLAGETKLAEALAFHHTEVNPPNLDAHLQLAQALFLQGNFDEAKQAGEAARRLATAGWERGTKGFAEAAYTLMPVEPYVSRTQSGAGDFQGAAETLRELYKLQDSDGQIGILVGHTRGYPSDYARALVALGRLDDADVVLQKLLAKLPDEGSTRWVNGLRLRARGQIGAAVAELRQARRLDPLNGLISVDLGVALLESGQWDEAMVELQRGVDKYDRRQIREFQLVPFQVAVAILRATSKMTPGEAALSTDARERMQDQAIGWVANELSQWQRKVQGSVPLEHSAAVQVLGKAVTSEAAKQARDTKLLAGLSAERRQAWLKVWDSIAPLRDEAATQSATIQGDPVAATYPLDREREIAQWVIEVGGMVRYWGFTSKGQNRFGPGGPLPTEPFRIIGLSLSNCPVGDADLERLSGLLALSEVHLDGTKVTDTGVRQLVEGAPMLRRLNVERTGVGDQGLAAVSQITEVYARRSAVTADAIARVTKGPWPVKVLHKSVMRKPPEVAASNESRLPALRFNGQSSSVELPIPYEFGRPLTIEASIVLEPGLHSSYARIVATDENFKTHGLISFVHAGQESHGAIVGNGVYQWTPQPSKPIPVLTRTDVAVTYDGETLRAFMNGKLLGMHKAQGVQAGLKLQGMTLGKAGILNIDHFQGIIDEVRISSICRYTADYVSVARLETDEHTEGLFHLDEGEGNIVRDSSGKGRDGKIFGAQWVREDEE